MANTSNYTEENIKSLDWREHIRLRPGMYIGKSGDGSSPDDGIYVLLKEVIDNCVDEFVMGEGKIIDIVINEVDALFNYDFTNQCYKTKHESLNFIRIGTSGSISENIEVNSHLISEYAIDLNSQLSFYDLDNYKI